MMQFTMQEIWRSLFCAIVFGIGFSLFFAAATIIANQIKRLRKLPSLFTRYDKIFEKPIKNSGRNENKTRSLFAAVTVILFAIGFVLLSYYTLDGSIRIYLFLVSFISFIIAKQLLYKHICSIINAIFDAVYHLIVVALRILFLPFLRLYLHIYAKNI